MTNYIIGMVILVVAVVAVLRIRKHFRGGGCCSSGGNTIRDKKTLEGPVVQQYTMTVQGMTCINCEIRVENALNRLEGVAGQVRWKKKTAVVRCSRMIEPAVLRETVEKLGYSVEKIENI